MPSQTFDVLDFSSAETRKGSPVLGARDACRTDSSLDVHQGSSCGGATLARGQRLLGGHCENGCRSETGGARISKSRLFVTILRNKKNAKEGIKETRYAKEEEGEKMMMKGDKKEGSEIASPEGRRVIRQLTSAQLVQLVSLLAEAMAG